MITVDALVWLLPRMTFLWKFSHNRCNDMGRPQSQMKGKISFLLKYFLTISTLMMFHTQYDRSYDGLDQYQEAEVLILFICRMHNQIPFKLYF